MKLWIDDVRPAPEDWEHIHSVYEAIGTIVLYEDEIEIISMDHDAGDYGPPDYIKLLDWLEETGRDYPIHIHSMNPVGVENMRRIIQKNGWIEVR